MLFIKEVYCIVFALAWWARLSDADEHPYRLSAARKSYQAASQEASDREVDKITTDVDIMHREIGNMEKKLGKIKKIFKFCSKMKKEKGMGSSSRCINHRATNNGKEMMNFIPNKGIFSNNGKNSDTDRCKTTKTKLGGKTKGHRHRSQKKLMKIHTHRTLGKGKRIFAGNHTKKAGVMRGDGEIEMGGSLL